jgi:hypothetical protein
MRWLRLRKEVREANKKQRHKWFAWYPVGISEESSECICWVWLRPVYRSGVRWHSWTESGWDWTYEEKSDE